MTNDELIEELEALAEQWESDQHRHDPGYGAAAKELRAVLEKYE
jgi:hypothetical protein